MVTYTDEQACVVASVSGGPIQHRRTIEAWAARDPVAARVQRDVVRREVRAEVGPDVPINVHIVAGYCDRCRDPQPPSSCPMCERINSGEDRHAPRHDGSPRCESGSIASGGNNTHCTCDTCF